VKIIIGGRIMEVLNSQCEDNLDPQLDQGNEEVIRVALLTLVLTKLRANRLLNMDLTYFT
jgi:hypothetical protein